MIYELAFKIQSKTKETEKLNSMLTPLFVKKMLHRQMFEGDNLHSFNDI